MQASNAGRRGQCVCVRARVCASMIMSSVSVHVLNVQCKKNGWLFIFVWIPVFYMDSFCVFACSFSVCTSVFNPRLYVCECFSVLLWDCRTTSWVLNNESKRWRGAKSHCSSLSLCTALTCATVDDWSLKEALSNRAKTLLSYPQPRSGKPQNSL